VIHPIRARQTLHKTGKKTQIAIEEVTRVASKVASALRHPTTARNEARRGNDTLKQQREGSDTLGQ
jgi:hypothetical protein